MRELWFRKIFLSLSHLRVRPFSVEQIFVFLQLELAHQAKFYPEIYALGIVSATVNLHGLKAF